MKTERDELKITKSLSNDSGIDFGIKDPAIVFDVLCTKLYKNPLKILVQEYMCNARDSHREFGNTHHPIKVVLPTALDKTLKIIDYGIGISPGRMNDIFIYLGESTKNKSDKETGGFGIGAKTAWAYTDSFTIKTVYDNVEYFYLAYIGDNGIGRLDLIEKNNKLAVNGTTIEVTIKINDFYDVEKYVYRTCHFWKTKPVIKNNKHFSFDNNRNEIKNKNFNIISNINGYSDYLANDVEYVNIVLDGIIYTNIYDYNIDVTGHFKLPANTAIYIHFGVNEIKPTVNRENILINDNSIKILSERYNNSINKLINDFVYGANKLKNFSELFKYINEYDSSKLKYINEFCYTFKNIKFKYQAATDSFCIDIPSSVRVEMYNYNSIDNILSFSLVIDKSLNIEHIANGNVIFNDKYTKTFNRNIIKRFCRDNKYNNIIIMMPLITNNNISQKDVEKDISHLMPLFKEKVKLLSPFKKLPIVKGEDEDKVMQIRFVSHYNAAFRWKNFYDVYDEYDIIINLKHQDSKEEIYTIVKDYNLVFSTKTCIVKLTNKNIENLPEKYKNKLYSKKDFLILAFNTIINSFTDKIIRNYIYASLMFTDINYINDIVKYQDKIEDYKLKSFIKMFYIYQKKMDVRLSANEVRIQYLYRRTKNALSYFIDIKNLTFEKNNLIKNYAKRKNKKYQKYKEIIENRYPLILALKGYNYIDAKDMVDYINCMHDLKIKNGELKCL